MENLLLSYATDLDDAYPNYEFSIWSREQLLNYFNEAICLIARFRPDMFTELKVVKVDPCSNYIDTCDCSKVLDVLGWSDKNGNNLRPLPKRANKSSVWTGNRKKKGFSDHLTEYELLSGGTVARVYPENLNPQKDYYIVVRCSVEPKRYSLDSIPPNQQCAFLSVARHWVLYNAKMVDGEFSQTLQAQAREHREMFLGILGLIKNADDEFEDTLQNMKRPQRR